MAVSISFYNPSKDLIKRNSLVTLSTLKTRANYGPALKNDINEFPVNYRIRSKIEAQTTKKSNWFHEFLIYPTGPRAIILSVASVIKIIVKAVFIC